MDNCNCMEGHILKARTLLSEMFNAMPLETRKRVYLKLTGFLNETQEIFDDSEKRANNENRWTINIKKSAPFILGFTKEQLDNWIKDEVLNKNALPELFGMSWINLNNVKEDAPSAGTFKIRSIKITDPPHCPELYVVNVWIERI